MDGLVHVFLARNLGPFHYVVLIKKLVQFKNNSVELQGPVKIFVIIVQATVVVEPRYSAYRRAIVMTMESRDPPSSKHLYQIGEKVFLEWYHCPLGPYREHLQPHSENLL